MSARIATLLVCAAAIAACRNDGARSTPAISSTGAPTSASGSAPRPADHQCLAVNICGQWSGCAVVAQDGPGRWSIARGDKVGPDAAVTVENVCTSGAQCIAAKAIPKGAVCTTTTPLYVAPPEYACVWDGASCHTAPK